MLQVLLITSSFVGSFSYVFPPSKLELETGQTLYVSGVEASEELFVKNTLNCNLMCASACLSFSNGLASVQCTKHCGCSSLISESPDFSIKSLQASSLSVSEETKIQSLQEIDKEEKIKWWIGTKTSKLNNIETCTAECQAFCDTIKGDKQTCNTSCLGKFCSQSNPKVDFPIWIFTFLTGLFLVICVVVKITADTIKINNQLEASLGYRKI